QKPDARAETKGSTAVEALIAGLTDENANVRHQAAIALGKMGAAAKTAIPALVQRVADDVWSTGGVQADNSSGNSSQDASVWALQQLAPDKVEDALIAATKSKNKTVKQWAAMRLADLSKDK